MTKNDPNIKLSVFCDGGARGNPGPAACAFVLLLDGNQIHSEGKFLGVANNNQAEYQGVLEALKYISENITRFSQVGSVVFFLDSLLIVNQLNGLYKIKDLILKEKAVEALRLIENCKLKIEKFQYVPRELNSKADALLNKTLDSQTS